MGLSIKPRMFDVGATQREMLDFKWGLFHYLLFLAEKYIKHEKDKAIFLENNAKIIENHGWLCAVLDYSKTDHERLLKEIHAILNGSEG